VGLLKKIKILNNKKNVSSLFQRGGTGTVGDFTYIAYKNPPPSAPPSRKGRTFFNF